MRLVMVDLETMGTGSDAAIVAFGAVEFDPHFMDEEDGHRFYRGKLGREFYYNVDLQSSLDAGLTVDASTVYWWLEQPEAARKALLTDKQPLSSVLFAFSKFWEEVGAETIWAHGVSFDISIIKSAYRKMRIKQPFGYNADRDTRSTYDITGWPSGEEKKLANKLEHHALEDAKAQAALICNALHRVRVMKGYGHTTEPTLIVPTAEEIPKEVWDKLEPNAVIEAHANAGPTSADLLKVYPDGNFPEGF